MADKYDVDAERSVQRANDRVRDSVRSEFAKTVTDHYASLDVEYSNIRLLNGKAKYALYPVWLLNTSWRGRKYTFAMNGQTGKFVGDLPIDKKARNLWFLGLAALFGIAVYGAMWLLAVL